jgi:hypothetical protein
MIISLYQDEPRYQFALFSESSVTFCAPYDRYCELSVNKDLSKFPFKAILICSPFMIISFTKMNLGTGYQFALLSEI